MFCSSSGFAFIRFFSVALLVLFSKCRNLSFVLPTLPCFPIFNFCLMLSDFPGLFDLKFAFYGNASRKHINVFVIVWRLDLLITSVFFFSWLGSVSFRSVKLWDPAILLPFDHYKTQLSECA